jgi:hypothetical protein
MRLHTLQRVARLLNRFQTEKRGAAIGSVANFFEAQIADSSIERREWEAMETQQEVTNAENRASYSVVEQALSQREVG